jgi:hypothetical protein
VVTARVLAMTAGSAATLTRPAQVVRGSGGRVVMILVGDDALGEAASWQSRGYRVESVASDQLGL